MLPNLLESSDLYKAKPFLSHHNNPNGEPSNKVKLPLIKKKTYDHSHSQSFEMSHSLHWRINELPKPQFSGKAKHKKNSWDQKHRLKTMMTKEGEGLKSHYNRSLDNKEKKGLNLGKFRKIFLNHLYEKNGKNENLICTELFPREPLTKKDLRYDKEEKTGKPFLTKIGLPSMSYSFEVICDYSSFCSAKGFSIQKQLPRKKQNSLIKQNETIDQNVEPIQKRANFSIQSPLNSQDLNHQFRLKLYALAVTQGKVQNNSGKHDKTMTILNLLSI